MTDWLDAIHDPHKLLAAILPYAMRVVAALAIFVIGRWVLKGLVALMRRMMERGSADQTLINFLSRLVFILGMALIVVAALSRLGVDTTSAAAILGGAAVAVGLALQNQLSSFAAGVMLIVFRPLRVGEWVEVAGHSGSVVEVNIFSTVLQSFGNQMVTVPNSAVWSGSITNYTRNPWRRLDLTIGIAYDADLLQAKKILEEIIGSDERILPDPPPSVAVKNLGESSIDFAVRVCANNSVWWALQCDLLERIKLRFDAEGVEIPFPQMDLHVKQMPQLGIPDAGTSH